MYKLYSEIDVAIKYVATLRMEMCWLHVVRIERIYFEVILLLGLLLLLIVKSQYTILCVMRLCDGADLEVGLSTRTVSDMQVGVIHHD